MQDRIKAALVAAFIPDYIDVQDESHTHHRGQETHYKAIIVSDVFSGLTAVKRHQKVYAALDDLMSQFHALALHTYTINEWQAKKLNTVPESPTCRGDSLHDLKN